MGRIRRHLLSLAVLGPCLCGALQAATLHVNVRTEDGAPVKNAVISLDPAGHAALPPVHERTEAMMDQHNREFVPHVLVVQAGTRVQFPNSDNIRHDVYSFSPAKTFELPLYKGVPAQPILFDKAGVVVLGCNIHDWMLGYIDVVDTPWFAKTGTAGAAAIDGLPPARYRLTLWQPNLEAEGQQITDSVDLTHRVSATRTYTLRLKPPRRSSSHAPETLTSKFARFRDEKDPALSN